MRVYKPTRKDENGKIQKYENWYIEFEDHRNIVRRLLGCRDKGETQTIGDNILKLVARKQNNEPPAGDLLKWLENAPSSLRNKLVEIGIIDSTRAAAGKPLVEHLADYADAMRNKENTEAHIDNVVTRAERLIKDCEFRFWTDLDANKVLKQLADYRKDKPVEVTEKDLTTGKIEKKTKIKRGISAQTFNFYLQSLQQFCTWMIEERRATQSPIAHISRLNVKTDRRHDRRALTVDEVRRLIETTKGQKFRFGMTGEERAWTYRIAVETGLRVNELRSLTVSSFDLKGCTVTLQAAYSKHRREDTLPLRTETAKELGAVLNGKLPTVPVFNLPVKTCRMLKKDLTAAGIEYIEDGLFADFHALRHTTGSLLAACGVHPKTIQEIMRHSDINLTMSRYTHIFSSQKAAAIQQMPDLSAPSQSESKKIG